MTFVSARWRFGILAAAALLAACGARSFDAGVANVDPATGRSSAPAAIRDTASAHPFDCGIARPSLPGKFVLVQSQGSIETDGRYTARDGIWEYGTVSPTTAPSPSSEPSGPRTPLYVYVGTYSLTTFKQTGCAYLVTSQSGKPLVGPDNAMLDATPWFANEAVTMQATQGGRMLVRGGISGVSTMALYDPKGLLVDKGTVTFTRRIATTDVASLTHGLAAAARPDFTFSCDPARYVYRTVQSAKPGTARGFGFDPKSSGDFYEPRFGFCGVDNSLLTPAEVSSTQSYSFAHGAITYRMDATFNPSVAWSTRPDVVVWEEAYRPDGVRDQVADMSIAIVRIR